MRTWGATVDQYLAHCSKVNEVNCNENDWVLDSGCTDHITNNDRYFEDCGPLDKPVNVYSSVNRVTEYILC